MRNCVNRINREKIWIYMIGLWTAVIFWNSLHTGADSGSMSAAVLHWLRSLPGTAWISSFVVRKAAHFTEFCILGTLYSLAVHTRGYLPQKRLVIPLLGVLQTALIDESIQNFMPDRTSAVRDVIIDFSGGICAVLLVAIPLWLLERKRIDDAKPVRCIMLIPQNVRCRRFFFVALILMVFFIWGNSILNAYVSNAMSKTTLTAIESIQAAAQHNNVSYSESSGTVFWLSNHILRKIAHFTEYLFLGSILCGGYSRILREYWHLLWLWGLVIPVIDEGIQCFSKGRTPLVTDVWIDFAGVASGIFLTVIFHRIGALMKTHM